MTTKKHSIQTLAAKLQSCLEEEDIAVDTRFGEHEVLVAARVDGDTAPLRVVVHVADRTFEPVGSVAIDPGIARTHLVEIASRPSLEARSAGGASDAGMAGAAHPDA